MIFNSRVDQDEYGEVLNSARTFEGIANLLHSHCSVVMGWTDGEGSHHDIQLTVSPIEVGSLHGGMDANTDVFVSVARLGMFGFKINDIRALHASYVAEKLNLDPHSSTTQHITDLINGVKRHLV